MKTQSFCPTNPPVQSSLLTPPPARAAVAALLAHLAPGGYTAATLRSEACNSKFRKNIILLACKLAPGQPVPAVIAALRAAGCLA